jgi:NAD-dependent deacetylase
MNNINNLKDLIDSSSYMIAFTGAGISVESGIPDFRSSGGLYTSGAYAGYNPEQILSKRFFLSSIKNKEVFFSFYKDRIAMIADKQPNRSHLALKKLEESGKLKCIITQNIDNLHQKAGSKHVLDLHGNHSQAHCISCQQCYVSTEMLALLEEKCPPRCFCGGIVRPSTVLFDEALDDLTYDAAIKEIKKADLILAIGSSLTVQPAAGMLLEKNETCKLVILNNTATPYDPKADLFIHENCGEVLESLVSY